MNRASAYHNGHRASSIFLVLALLWMTVSLPFVSFGHQRSAAALLQHAAFQADQLEHGVHAKPVMTTAAHPDTDDLQVPSPADAAQDDADEDDNSRCPFGNSEEKAPSSGINSLVEEYLSHDEHGFHDLEIFLSHHPAPEVFEYVSFHGELLSPPPNC